MSNRPAVGAFRKPRKQLSGTPKPSHYPHLRSNAAWLIKASGETNSEIASVVGVAPATVWRWRRRMADIREINRKAFASRFGVTIQQLLFVDLRKG